MTMKKKREKKWKKKKLLGRITLSLSIYILRGLAYALRCGEEAKVTR